MKNRLKLMVFLLFLSVLIISCHTEYDATVEELDLAITHFDENQNFGELNTFYLYDTIMYITDDEDADLPDWNEGQGPHILAQVRGNLESLGWQENRDTIGGVQADASILISVLETDVNFYYYGWWDWWHWYPWYPYQYESSYWWGYPIWPGPVYPSYGYTVGTVLIDMINVNEIKAPNLNDDNPHIEIPVVWTGAVNGILAGSDKNIENRLTNEIEQVFKQSSYLHK